MNASSAIVDLLPGDDDVEPTTLTSRSYGYLFGWIDAVGAFSARGIFGQTVLVIPSEGLVVVTNAAFPTATGQEGSQAVNALVAGVREALR